MQCDNNYKDIKTTTQQPYWHRKDTVLVKDLVYWMNINADVE